MRKHPLSSLFFPDGHNGSAVLFHFSCPTVKEVIIQRMGIMSIRVKKPIGLPLQIMLRLITIYKLAICNSLWVPKCDCLGCLVYMLLSQLNPTMHKLRLPPAQESLLDLCVILLILKCFKSPVYFKSEHVLRLFARSSPKKTVFIASQTDVCPENLVILPHCRLCSIRLGMTWESTVLRRL